MSDTQFWLVAAIPSVLVIVFCVLVVAAKLQQDKRLARLEAHCDSLAATMETGFTRVSETMDRGLKRMCQRGRRIG